MSADKRLNKATGLVNEMRDKVNAIFAEYVPMLHKMLPELCGDDCSTAREGRRICDRRLHVCPEECPGEYPQTCTEAKAQGWELEFPFKAEDFYEHWHKTVNGVNVTILFEIDETLERTE